MGGNTEEGDVVPIELVKGDERDGLVLGRSVHYAEDFFGESLYNSVRMIISVTSVHFTKKCT